MTATISDSSSRAHGRVPVVSPASPGEKMQELADYQPYVDRPGDVVRPIRIPAKIGPASLAAAQDGPRVVRRPGPAVHRLPGGGTCPQDRCRGAANGVLAAGLGVLRGDARPDPPFTAVRALPGRMALLRGHPDTWLLDLCLDVLRRCAGSR